MTGERQGVVRMAKKAVSKRAKMNKKVTRQTEGLSNSFYGYEFVLLVDAKTRLATWIGGSQKPSLHLYQKNALHAQALEETLKQGIYHYEWTAPHGKKYTSYQTTCIAIQQPDGLAAGVLSLSRNISGDSVLYQALAGQLRENSAPHTFAQILLAAREAEKRDISKVLHDEIGSSAVMLTALLSLVRSSVQTGNAKQALRDLTQLDNQIKESIERIKNVVVSMRPPSLENKGGLGGAVRDLLENISALSHVPYTFDYDAVDEQISLSDNVKIMLYRIVQEALTNTIKHARAKHIRVSLRQAGEDIKLLVCDDGIGFKPSRQISIEHVGLLAMKDSVELLGGKITIKSAPGKGTRIEVICPSVVYGGNSK